MTDSTSPADLRPSLDEIRAARERIGGEIDPTPCRRARSLEEFGAGRVYLKFENLHRTGSFKERGALNKLLTMSEADRRRGVITASAGNHAQALALHASRLGVPATVVMPLGTPLVKVTHTRRYGARVILHGATFDDAVDEARRRCAEEGQVFVPAFNDPAVVAGQGTVGLELLEQVADFDVVAVPVGGGGLVSGIARAVKAARPEVRIVGVEAAAVPSAARARIERGPVLVAAGDTIADGIAVKRVGEVTFPLLERFVDTLVTVDDDQIAAAVLRLLEREKTLAEGGGAAAVAALMAGRLGVGPQETVVAVVSGGNIDINMVSRIIDHGLVADGRLTRLRITVRDRPGQLARVLGVVGGLGANLLETVHSREFADISVGEVEIVLTLETRGREHVEEIARALAAEGMAVEEMV